MLRGPLSLQREFKIGFTDLLSFSRGQARDWVDQKSVPSWSIFFSSHCSEKHGKHSRDALANNSRCSIAMQYWEGRQASNKKSEVENSNSG